MIQRIPNRARSGLRGSCLCRPVASASPSQGTNSTYGMTLRVPAPLKHPQFLAQNYGGPRAGHGSRFSKVVARLKTNLFSTYRQGRNRVTGSIVAVFERIDLALLQRILPACAADHLPLSRPASHEISALLRIVMLTSLLSGCSLDHPSVDGKALALSGSPAASQDNDWVTYGHDYGNQRFSPLREISVENVTNLAPAYEVQTGVVGAFETRPWRWRPRNSRLHGCVVVAQW